MKRKSKSIACTNYTWNLIQRNAVYYADGRSCATNLGVKSLGTKDREEALKRLPLLDHKMAVEFGIQTLITYSLELLKYGIKGSRWKQA